MRRELIAIAVLGMVACDAPRGVDARFSTPEHTIETLLASYGLEDATQEDIRARMAAHERFELRDRASFEACFADLPPGPVGEGLAGWVLGAIAAGRDELRVEIFGDRATVAPREGVRIAMRREDGAWRIVLDESVPSDVRRALDVVAERHDRRAREQGLPTE
ncbi:hypothetical protein [Sandaracinus amylolyticus]|uniref:DUF3828 domain-containing protein n=1 Tax=Sandaracinus amylolyticus TaxID=927083 RepID=A0A0F6W912_9BACT|nr:hypothetical protein [Sandaracinus amylolyticus]AKF10480.1 hypothetical protein DB32_007629 [Sandaracinus amylolyticus]